MDSKEFSILRSELKKSQRDIGRLLGVSLGAIHSYEQGWRDIPPHVERQVLFLISMKRGIQKQQPCWKIKDCPREVQEKCPAKEFRLGQLCWFVNGTICCARAQEDWSAKMEICRKCEVFRRMIKLPANGKLRKRSPRSSIR